MLYPTGLRESDRPLWDAAVQILATSYVTGRHEVAAAIRDVDGNIHVGLHLEGSAGRSSVCAEGAALGATLVAAQTSRPGAPLGELVDTVLAVLHRPTAQGSLLRIVAPCGVCRELLSDHCPDAQGYVHHPHTTDDAPVTLIEAPGPGILGSTRFTSGACERVRLGDLLPGSTRRAR